MCLLKVCSGKTHNMYTLYKIIFSHSLEGIFSFMTIP